MRRRFHILLRSLSPNIPISGWWSVTNITFVQLIINMWHFSNAKAIAADLPSIGAYQHSASVQNLLPTNTMHHPSGQHTGVLSMRHLQGFCNSRKPISSLLQSGARQVTLLVSKMITPFLSKPTISFFDFWNAFFRLSFHKKGVFCLTRSRNGNIIGHKEYAHATWLTSPNQDLVSVIFFGVGKSEVFRWRHSWWCYLKASKLNYILKKLEHIFVEDNSILFT